MYRIPASKKNNRIRGAGNSADWICSRVASPNSTKGQSYGGIGSQVEPVLVTPQSRFDDKMKDCLPHFIPDHQSI
jgi:hypothetical protein